MTSLGRQTHTCAGQLGESFAHHLVVTLVNLDMYAADSRHVEGDLREVLRQLGELTQHGQPVRLHFTGQQVALDGHTLRHASLQAGRIMRLCREREIAGIVFHPGIEADELLRFLQLLTDEASIEALRRPHLEAALRQHGIARIEVELRPGLDDVPPPLLPMGGTEDTGITDGDVHALRHYQAMADLLQQSHVAAFRGDSLAVDAAAGLIEDTILELDREPSDLLSLAMNDNIDQFTVGHSVRVTLLALHVAQEFGAPRQDLLRLGTAALLHDIGKSLVPQEILFKPAGLDAEERDIMSQHARWGGELLLEHGGVDPAAIGAAFCHHMSPAGQGYPQRPSEFEPSGIAQLVRVCDVFEALTSVRPYKQALNTLHAYVIMHRMRGGFDERWLRFFIKSIGLYPLGTELVLDSGEDAVVVGAGPSLLRPVVEVVRDAEGQPLPLDESTQRVVGGTGEPAIRAVTGASTRTQFELPPDVMPDDDGSPPAPPSLCC